MQEEQYSPQQPTPVNAQTQSQLKDSSQIQDAIQAEQRGYDDQYSENPVGTESYRSEYFPHIVKPTVEELVYEWQAPTRPFKQRSKQFYTTVITIAILISLILFFSGQILPIAVIVAVVFLFYVLSTIPPSNAVVQFTTFGIRFEEQVYVWEELGRFWLDTAFDQDIIHIEVSRFPNRLTLLIGNGDKDLIIEMLSEILVMQKPAPTMYEKAAAWLTDKLPLDIDK